MFAYAHVQPIAHHRQQSRGGIEPDIESSATPDEFKAKFDREYAALDQDSRG